MTSTADMTRTRKLTRKAVMNKSANADEVSQTVTAVWSPVSLSPNSRAGGKSIVATTPPTEETDVLG